MKLLKKLLGSIKKQEIIKDDEKKSLKNDKFISNLLYSNWYDLNSS